MSDSEKGASGTAYGVALLRLAHQLIDEPPLVLVDPIIGLLLRTGTGDAIRENVEKLQSPPSRGLRSHIVLRSRFAEDCLASAAERGIKQYVLLGAGLDTFAYRQPSWGETIEVIEVDHPASQAAKRDALARARIAVPSNVRYADVDFERETLADGLVRCGVSRDVPTFFSWLGVTMYLTRDAIDAVLSTIATFPPSSEIVLTFSQPHDSAEDNRIADGAAAMGEPWLSYFTLEEIRAVLSSHGFSQITFLDRDTAFERYYTDRRDGLEPPRRVSTCRAVV
jgi:methyltransferase (TIGR00027 family)